VIDSDLHSGRPIEIAVFVLLLILCRFQSGFFLERALLVLKNSITISVTKIGIVEPVTLKKPALLHVDFNRDFNPDFLHGGTPLLLIVVIAV